MRHDQLKSAQTESRQISKVIIGKGQMREKKNKS